MGDSTSVESVRNGLGANEFEAAYAQQNIEQPSGDTAADEGASAQSQDVPPQHEKAQVDPLELVQTQGQFFAEQNGSMPSQADSIDWNAVQFSQKFPDELQPYESVIMSRVVDLARHVIRGLESDARAQYEQSRRIEAQNKLTRELQEIMSSPLATTFREFKDEVIGVAQTNPSLLQKVGIKGILKMFAPITSQPQTIPSPQPQQNYTQGVKDGLARLQQRRNAATQPPQHNTGGSTQPVSSVKAGMSLNQAIEAAFNEAAEKLL